jgi:hemoglobin-like flavoprotein
MLSEQSAATIRATLPAVGASLPEIAERFYDGLFTAHPELLRNLFNRGNQAAGTQRQALAGSIAAFAAYLVDHPDERPDVMLNRIAHKHASLGVAPEQYKVVHQHLFAAIAAVLGDAVTPEVAAAWDEVYWLMANALIAIEKRLYEASGQTGWRTWRVAGRVEETADVATFQLRPADDGPVPDFRPGQYVSASSCRTTPGRSASTASPPRPAHRCGRSASSACRATRAPTGRSPATCTHAWRRATPWSCPLRTATSSWTRTRHPCCSPPPASA